MVNVHAERIRGAWLGRISGCQLGKAVEILSMREGRDALTKYLGDASALPLRDYVPALPGSFVETVGANSCRGRFVRMEPDDDINYSVLALGLLEEHGVDFDTADVGRAWLRHLPGGMTFTAERVAYAKLLAKAPMGFGFGAPPGFDLSECSDNEYNDWIGAQIRADVYGWVCPGRTRLAADLARRDAELSHRGDGVYGAMFVAALGAAIPVTSSIPEAVIVAAREIPADSEAAKAIEFGRSLVGNATAVDRLHERYGELSPVHTVNNLALVVWALIHGADDFSCAIGDAVAAGWDTDCNGATVGALWGLSGRPIPEHWTQPWNGRVVVSLAGVGELAVDDLVERTVAVAQKL